MKLALDTMEEANNRLMENIEELRNQIKRWTTFESELSLSSVGLQTVAVPFFIFCTMWLYWAIWNCFGAKIGLFASVRDDDGSGNVGGMCCCSRSTM